MNHTPKQEPRWCDVSGRFSLENPVFVTFSVTFLRKHVGSAKKPGGTGGRTRLHPPSVGIMPYACSESNFFDTQALFE